MEQEKISYIREWLEIILMILSIPILSYIAYLIGVFKTMDTPTLTLYLIAYCQIVFDIGIVIYLKQKSKEKKLFEENYKQFNLKYLDFFLEYRDFIRLDIQRDKESKNKISSLEQDILFPLYAAVSNAQGITLLNDDKKRMENHREEYIKKYGYF